MERNTSPSPPLLVTRFTGEQSGKKRRKARSACSTREVRSARNSTRLTQLQRVSSSVREIAVRVLPVPVACTSNALRRPFSNDSQIARIARCW